jgi:hypothetical protein
MRSTSQRLKWDISAPRPDAGAPESAARPSEHDQWMRALGYLLLGIVIPRFALIFDKLAVGEIDYWIGTTWFLLAAVAIFETNRWIALRLRAHLDWLVHPFWKITILAAANFACTVPLTIAAVWAWLRYINSPFPSFDWLGTIRATVTNNTVTVLFLLHAYETLFLIRERHGDRRRLEQLDRARLAAELETMKGQLAPHFLFNCLNTMAALIERDPKTAAEFNGHLADVSRYLLAQKNRDLVPLAEELAFLRSYVRLMELRFPHSLQVRLPPTPEPDAHRVPPAALQLLLENAIKHNRLSEAEPLAIDVRFAGDAIVVANPLRPKAGHREGTGTGLANLRERVALLTKGQLEIEVDDDEFRVRLPLA